MSVPSITLCMIVKDEEKTVAASLESASALADDIVVVDTGSTDATPSIAARYTPRLYRFAWTDDFAAARNFAMEHVRSEWILWLDADERLDVRDATRWRQSFADKSARADALLVEINNYYGPVVDELKVHVYSGFRLLRAAAKLRYVQPIHEHLDASRDDVRFDHEPVDGVAIHHYGYMDDAVRQKRKAARNMRLLQKERTRPNYDPWIDYHIASEHYRRRDYVNAYRNVQKAMKRFLDMGRLPPALAYRLKYELLLVTGSTQNALAGIEHTVTLYPDYVDLHYYKGLFQYATGRFDDALKTFAACLRIGENSRYLTRKGTGSFMASYMMGRCREALGQTHKATDIYRRLIERFPGFKPPLARLEALRRRKESW